MNATKRALDQARNEQLGKRCPVCPECKEPLVFRPADRRFMEDDYYVQCLNLHVWELHRQGLQDQSPGR